jgi:hypothetical protein
MLSDSPLFFVILVSITSFFVQGNPADDPIKSDGKKGTVCDKIRLKHERWDFVWGSKN